MLAMLLVVSCKLLQAQQTLIRCRTASYLGANGLVWCSERAGKVEDYGSVTSIFLLLNVPGRTLRHAVAPLLAIFVLIHQGRLELGLPRLGSS